MHKNLILSTEHETSILIGSLEFAKNYNLQTAEKIEKKLGKKAGIEAAVPYRVNAQELQKLLNQLQ